MPKTSRIRLATFLPAEVAAISGVGPGLQRSWRHMGYSDTGSGKSWTRHSLQQMAALTVQGALFKRGIPPRVSRICARAAALQILMWAQKNPRATAGGKGSKPSGMWLKKKSKPRRFLVQWGLHKRNYEFTTDLNRFYQRKRSHDVSAAIVIDLMRLANQLVTAAGRPLAVLRKMT